MKESISCGSCSIAFIMMDQAHSGKRSLAIGHALTPSGACLGVDDTRAAAWGTSCKDPKAPVKRAPFNLGAKISLTASEDVNRFQVLPLGPCLSTRPFFGSLLERQALSRWSLPLFPHLKSLRLPTSSMTSSSLSEPKGSSVGAGTGSRSEPASRSEPVEGFMLTTTNCVEPPPIT
jgi:hypothetical protein